MKHAGWNNKPVILPDKKSYEHKEWRHKSKRNIELFIEHFLDRYINMLKYFRNKPNAIVVDICGNKGIEDLRKLLGKNRAWNRIRNRNMKVPHKNRGKQIQLSNDVLVFIDEVIEKNEENLSELNGLIR